jgi:MSHA biogenesis protein MshP
MVNGEWRMVNRESKKLTRFAQRGFSIATAIFLIVVLALLGVFIVSIASIQQSSQQIDLQGVRAYQAARAGIEWAAFQVLDPNNTLNPATCGTAFVNCPGGVSPSDTPLVLAESLAAFAVLVHCERTTTTEGNRDIRVFAITSTATTGTPGTPGFVSRQLRATLGKCHDPTADAPRCACG